MTCPRFGTKRKHSRQSLKNSNVNIMQIVPMPPPTTSIADQESVARERKTVTTPTNDEECFELRRTEKDGGEGNDFAVDIPTNVSTGEMPPLYFYKIRFETKENLRKTVFLVPVPHNL